MRTITRRLCKLEERLAPPVAGAGGWSAKAELLKRMNKLAERMEPIPPECRPSVESVRQQWQEYVNSLKRAER